MGTLIQGYGLGEDDYRGTPFAAHGHDIKGNSDLLSVTQPEIIGEIHRRYLEAGADIVCTNTFTATSITQADYGLEDHCYEINRQAAAARPRGRRRALHRRPAALRRRLARPDQPHRLDLAGRQRPGRAQRGLRRAGRLLHRGGQRPGRRGSRPAPGRDDLRHPQRQGRDLRPRDAVRGARTTLAGDHLRHHHRRQRPHPLGPDDRGVLELGAPRPPARRRPQLRARRRGDAPVRRGAVAASPTASSPRTPTPDCPTSSASTTRPPSRWPTSSASSSPTAWSTSSAAAAAPTPTTSRPSPTPRRASSRASYPTPPEAMRLSGLEPFNITPTRCSSTSASAPTSPARPSSAT